ncbi:class I SAM-dependent methyltransferase [Methylosinus sp. H3A]|uniref:methyltransferase domain-containing protein n=1 Tax=Methylosinus sp. H3A TaxID=2785786 RepID=UPI0018C34882|nr:class I SAM-dependent methyltransferase [Methylosinus sp. H3A]MBG0811260.1 class I SAM-dependent methyltransferase [Methylosinus sp. H3A]
MHIHQIKIDKSSDQDTLISIDDTDISAGQIRSGPLSGYNIIDNNGVFYFRIGEYYLCADGESFSVTTDRLLPRAWESFTLVHPDRVDRIKTHGSAAEEMTRFRSRVEQLTAQGKPVKLYVGAGEFPRRGFLNVDRVLANANFSFGHFEDYFLFPCVDMHWDIAENSVDYIFHEDFIEHLDQTDQFRFLAEALRVLKPGCWHRVNTPDIIWTMKTRSDFSRGLEGVYTGERQWGHLSIFSHASLAEVAKTVGYKEVVFTKKNTSVSPYAEADHRPLDDRDPVLGNIYADLMKG